MGYVHNKSTDIQWSHHSHVRRRPVDMAIANKFLPLEGHDSEQCHVITASWELEKPTVPVMRMINRKKDTVCVPFYSEPGGCRSSRHSGESRFIQDLVNVGNCVSSNNEFPGGYGTTGYEDGDEYGYSTGDEDGYSPGYEDGDDFGYGNGGKRSEREYDESTGVFHGGRRCKFRNGKVAEGNRRKRIFDRHSQSRHRAGMKRRGSGRANWGSPDDDIYLATKGAVSTYGNYLDSNDDESECEDFGDEMDMPEDDLCMVMTLKEHEEVLEQKKKSLEALKTRESGVIQDKDFEDKGPRQSKRNDDVMSSNW